MAANQIGFVSASKGEVFARNADGQMRRLRVGDPVFEKETIVTANGSSVEITPLNGPVLNIAEQQTLVLDDQVFASAPDASSGGVSPLSSTQAAQVIQTAGNQDFNQQLDEEAAAAGLTGGGDGAGHSFVDLVRIVEGINPVGFGFPTNAFPDPLRVAGVNQNGLPTAGDLTISLDEDDIGGRKMVYEDRLSLRDSGPDEPAWMAAFSAQVGFPMMGSYPGNNDEATADDLPVDSPTTQSGTLNFSYGPDGAGSLVFNLPASTPSLTSGGEPVQFWVSADGHTLVGYVEQGFDMKGPPDSIFSVQSEGPLSDGPDFVKVLFTAEITDVNGGFTFNLYGQLDHPVSGTEDNLQLPLSFTVTDASGDSAVGTLTLNLDDDIPVLLGDAISQVASGVIQVSSEDDSQEETGDDGSQAAAFAFSADTIPTSSIDSWKFTVNEDGPVTINILAADPFASGPLLDTQIYLFKDNGGVPGDLVFTNDDSTNARAFEDGTWIPYDSFGQLTLPAGNYILRIGAHELTETEARGRVNTHDSDEWVQGGEYQVTFGGNVEVTSAPGEVAPPTNTQGDTFMVEEDSPPASGVGNDSPDHDKLLATQYGVILDDVAWGADGFGSATSVTVGGFTFVIPAETDTNPADARTSLLKIDLPGAHIYFDADGEVIPPTAPSTGAAAELLVRSDGHYTFTVLDNMDHTGIGTNDDTALKLPKILITGVDGDGDPVQVPLFISVQDDVPVLVAGRPMNVVIDEDDIDTPWSEGTSPRDGNADGSYTEDNWFNPVDPAIVTGSLSGLVSFGADGQAARMAFGFTTDAIAQMTALHLFSKQSALPENGQELTYSTRTSGGWAILTATEPDSGPGDTSNPVFELRVNQATGEYEFRLFDELIHQAPTSGADENFGLRSGQFNDGQAIVDSINFGALIQATDGDGDTITLNKAFTIQVRDDIPEVNVSVNRYSDGVLHDESSGIQNDDTTSSAVRNLFNSVANRGDDPDVAGSGAIGYANSGWISVVTTSGTEVGADSPELSKAFSLVIDNSNSGLMTTEGALITLSLEGGLIVGRIPPVQGETLGKAAFAITVDQEGGISVAQYLTLRHPNTGSSDEEINLGNSISIRYTVTDSDGDTVSDTVRVGQLVRFDDDGPSIDVSRIAGADVLTVDESNLAINATANFADNFSIVSSYGADGAGSTSASYGLSVRSTGVDSGMDDAATSTDIRLYVNAQGAVEGRVGTSGPVAFTVSVDSTGTVTLDQLRAIEHPTTNPDESITLSNSNLITLTRRGSITDGDGDTDSDSASIDIGRSLVFKDDGPSILVQATKNPQPTLLADDSFLDLEQDPTATGGFAHAFRETSNYGADGPGVVTTQYSLWLKSAGAASGLTVYDGEENVQPVLLYLNNGVVEGRAGSPTGELVFTVSTDNTGYVTLKQLQGLINDSESELDPMQTISNDLIRLYRSSTIADADGDQGSSSAYLQIGASLTFLHNPGGVEGANNAHSDTVLTNIADAGGSSTETIVVPDWALLQNDSDGGTSTITAVSADELHGAESGFASVSHDSAGVSAVDVAYGGILSYTLDDGSHAYVTVDRDQAGSSELHGTANAEILIGSDSGSTISGLGGDDILIGGVGNDILNGGAGADTFAWSLADVPAGTATDIVKDFGTGDTLQINDLLDGGSATLTVTAGASTEVHIVNGTHDQTIVLENYATDATAAAAIKTALEGTGHSFTG